MVGGRDNRRRPEMRWIVDRGRRMLVDDYIADLVEMEQRNRGFGRDLEADRQAYSRIHSAAPASAKVTPAGAAPAFTGDDLVGKPKPSGWVDPLPLGPPPGTNLVDRVAKAFEEQDRVVEAGLRRRLKP
jgi:hypothetical protein